MPLTYQGPLTQRVFKRPLDAYQHGSSMLAELSPKDRLDLRLAWDQPKLMHKVSEHFGDAFDGCWIDIAVVPTDSVLDQLMTWADQLQGGQLSVLCLKKDFEAEVSISLPRLGSERLDDERCASRTQAEDESIKVRIARIHQPGDMSSLQLEQSAQRCRSAFNTLSETLSGPIPSFTQWLETYSTGNLASKWCEGELTASAEWIPSPYLSESTTPWESVRARPRIFSQCPIEMSCEFPAQDRETARTVWVRWINLLKNVETVIIRCRGTLKKMTDVLDEVDLYHYHPNRQSHAYGMTTIHEKAPMERAALESLIESREFTHNLSDWDVRWSDLRLQVGEELTQLIGTSNSHYTIRTESNRTLNRLQVSLHLNDPQDSRFRSAKRILGGYFGDSLSRDAAWEFEGPALDTPMGRDYRRLQDALEHLVVSLNSQSSELEPAPSGNIADLIPFGGGGHLEGQALIDRIGEAINAALPGFRFDRRAHVTEKYFLEFVRRTPGGFHLIEIQRYYRPAGFSVRIAASQYRIPINDLIAATGCAVPGIVIALEELVPERPPRWSYKRSRMFDRVLDDFSLVLERRVLPFFEQAEVLLKEHNVDQKEVQ